MKNRLPNHTPPPDLWERLEAELDGLPRHPDMWQKLPVHTPPERVWEQLMPLQKPKHKRHWAAAASVAIGLAVGMAIWLRTPMEQLSYQIELQPAALQLPTHAPTAELVALFCQQEPLSCATPRVAALRQELQELTAASEALQAAMGPYHNNPELAAQLSEIERQRNGLIQQLVNELNT